MRDIILEILSQYGYLGIFLLILVENIFPPIPSEVILTFGGFLTTYTKMNVWLVILFSTLGSFLGAILLYYFGRILTPERMNRLLASRPARLLRLKQEDVRKAEGWFLRHGGRAVFFCRFVPIVRSMISIPAGSARMRLRTFLPLTLAGTLIWNTVLVFLGRFMGDAWEVIEGYMDIYSKIALVAFGIIGAVLAVLFIKKRFLSGKEETPEEAAQETENQTEESSVDS